jgi:hypothetical protein
MPRLLNKDDLVEAGFAEAAVEAGLATQSTITTVVNDAFANTFPTRLSETLPAAGVPVVTQVARNPGQGGNPSTSRLQIIQPSGIVKTGDRATPQDDIDYAASRAWKYQGDPTAVLTISQTLRIPQNLLADFNKMLIQPGASFSGGTPLVRMGGSNGSRDFGRVDNLYLQVPYNAQGNADITRTIDGLEIGNGTDYVRQCAFGDVVILGVRDALRFVGSNNFIWDFASLLITKAWRRGIYYNCDANSGERMTIAHATIGNVANPSFDGTALYVDPAGAASPWFMFGKTSMDYCDRTIEMTHGTAFIEQAHFENNNNAPYINLKRTAGRKPPKVAITQAVMLHGNGIGEHDWTGSEYEYLSGRPSYIDIEGGNISIMIDQVDLGEYVDTARATQIWRTKTPANPPTVCIQTMEDAGMNPSQAGLGIGIPFSSGPVHAAYNSASAGSYLDNWTPVVSSGTGTWAAQTTDMLPGEVAGRTLTSSGSASTARLDQVMSLGDARGAVVLESYVHVGSYTAGAAGLQVTQAADAAIAFQVQNRAAVAAASPAGTGGAAVMEASPISSATATISAPSTQATSTFTPGTNQQGTFRLGMMLSGAGVPTNCYITAVNGDGTFKVRNESGAAVSATTIKGWSKVAMRIPLQAGGRHIRISELCSGFQGVATYSRTRARIDR